MFYNKQKTGMSILHECLYTIKLLFLLLHRNLNQNLLRHILRSWKKRGGS